MAQGGRTYLDWNATAPMRREAIEAVTTAMARVGNAASLHAEGRWALGAVEHARRDIAALVGASPQGVVFTSGATEAMVTALTPHLRGGEPFSRLIIGATEHACVLAGGRFEAALRQITPVDADGRIDLDTLTAMLARNAGPALVAVQWANNETGVIQDVAAIAQIVRRAGGLLAVDAVQAAGRVAIDLRRSGADLLALSSHKIGGPAGVGALIFADPDHMSRDPLLRGGGQEKGARAGTLNVAGIAGFGAAARAALNEMPSIQAHLSVLRDGLEAELARHLDIAVFGAQADRLPNTLLFGHAGLDAATLLMQLDLAGFAVSSGSACSSGKVGRSQVLQAMGVDAGLARSAIRVSMGHATTQDDVIGFADAYMQSVARQTTTRERRVA